MAKKYFIVDGGNKIGPLNLDEMEGKLYPETLVWHDELDDWKNADQLPELQDMIIKLPPPIPKGVRRKSNTEVKLIKLANKLVRKRSVLRFTLVFFVSFLVVGSYPMYKLIRLWNYMKRYSHFYEEVDTDFIDVCIYGFDWGIYIFQALLLTFLILGLRWLYVKYIKGKQLLNMNFDQDDIDKLS